MNKIVIDLTDVSISEMVKSQGDFNRSDKENNDCTVLAMSASFGISYDKANEYFKKNLDRVEGKGVRLTKLRSHFDTVEQVRIGDVTKSVRPVDTKNAYVYKRTGKVNYCRMNLNSFIKKYPKGSYYMVAGSHAFVIKDGKVIDHDYMKSKMNRVVKNAWQIK
jgi:hypothetical protein